MKYIKEIWSRKFFLKFEHNKVLLIFGSYELGTHKVGKVKLQPCL